MNPLLRCSLAATISALLLGGCGSYDIARNHNLTYDMVRNSLTTSYTAGATIKEGDFVSFELVNVNPFLYDVTINQKAISYGVELPPPVRMPFRRADLRDTVLRTTVIQVDNGGRINVAAVSRFRDKYSAFRRQYNIFHGFITFDDYLYTAIRQPFVDEKGFKEDLQNRLSSAAGGSRVYDRTDFINKGEEFYTNLTRAYSELTSEFNILDTASRQEVRDIISDATRAYADISDRGAWSVKVANAADLYTVIQSTPFTFSSFKTQASGRGVGFTINGMRREGGGAVVPYNVRPFNLDYFIHVNGGWEIDFSAGMFVSNLVNESFLTREERGDKIILKKEGDIVAYGPGALMHFYYQPWGIGGGVGAFTNNFANVQYMAGGSLLLGDDKRFCLNGGITFGKVTRLADGLQVGTPLAVQRDAIDVVPTTDRMDLGWFAGISYNFTAGLK